MKKTIPGIGGILVVLIALVIIFKPGDHTFYLMSLGSLIIAVAVIIFLLIKSAKSNGA